MVREALSKKEHKEELGAGTSDSPDHSDEDELSFDARMRQQILRRRQELGDKPAKKESRNGEQIFLKHLICHRLLSTEASFELLNGQG